MDREKLRTVLVTDCGSTTTKALLFEKKGDRWHQTFRGEAPTTVEAPIADVTQGALNAFLEIQELSGRGVIEEKRDENAPPFLMTKEGRDSGIDIYLSTSSAGGGLQMLVAGLVKTMTTESAERAALGAGAIVMEAISADDGREEHEKIERIRHLKPDIVLLTGGVDGGSRNHVIEMAEILVAASPRPRFGDTLKLPVIFAGNQDAADEVKSILGKISSVMVVDNVRPTLDLENLEPAREAIHEFFLSHVMSHSPGCGKLMNWSPRPIIPTPAAVGDIVQSYAKRSGKNVLCVDIGGATTDVFSVFTNKDSKQVFNRTVSANLGMSYSVANVLIEAGVDHIRRWLPFFLSEEELRDRLRNKMIRPTSIPQIKDDLWLEQAVCREALRLSLQHHRSLAVGLGGAQRQRGIADLFSQTASRYELVDMMALDIVIGSGGVISHAPNRMSAALMMIDGFGLEGVTELAVDSIFMMPHLGVFAALHSEAAEQIFTNDCLVKLGFCIAPVAYNPRKTQPELAKVLIDGKERGIVKEGVVSHIPLDNLQEVSLEVIPLNSQIDVGVGMGEKITKQVSVGGCGIILDGRKRPFAKYADDISVSQQRVIFNTLGL